MIREKVHTAAHTHQQQGHWTPASTHTTRTLDTPARRHTPDRKHQRNPLPQSLSWRHEQGPDFFGGGVGRALFLSLTCFFLKGRGEDPHPPPPKTKSIRTDMFWEGGWVKNHKPTKTGSVAAIFSSNLIFCPRRESGPLLW